MAHLGLATTTKDRKGGPAVGRARRKTSSAVDAPASELFLSMVLHAIDEKPASFLDERGRIAIVMKDDKSFTVRLGDAKEPLAWGDDEEAELRLVTEQAVVKQILDGTVNAMRELTEGRLVIEGDIEVLPGLFRLLERGKSMVSLRAGR